MLFSKKLKRIVNTSHNEIKNMKFSELIIELTETWLKWMPKNKLSHDHSLSAKVRRKYAEECEILIDHEYQIVERIDKFFVVKNEQN